MSFLRGCLVFEFELRFLNFNNNFNWFFHKRQKNFLEKDKNWVKKFKFELTNQTPFKFEINSMIFFFPNISKFFTASKIPTTRIFFPEWKEVKNNWRENIKRQKERKAQQQIQKNIKKQKEILKRTAFFFFSFASKRRRWEGNTVSTR